MFQRENKNILQTVPDSECAEPIIVPATEDCQCMAKEFSAETVLSKFLQEIENRSTLF